MCLLRPTLFARSPFWVLIAAWFCANTPQTARHFSHQEQLQAQVRAAPLGEAAENSPRYVATATAATTIENILLSPESAGSPPASFSTTIHGHCESQLMLIAHTADVPHPPPRA